MEVSRLFAIRVHSRGAGWSWSRNRALHGAALITAVVYGVPVLPVTVGAEDQLVVADVRRHRSGVPTAYGVALVVVPVVPRHRPRRTVGVRPERVCTTTEEAVIVGGDPYISSWGHAGDERRKRLPHAPLEVPSTAWSRAGYRDRPDTTRRTRDVPGGVYRPLLDRLVPVTIWAGDVPAESPGGRSGAQLDREVGPQRSTAVHLGRHCEGEAPGAASCDGE